MLVVGFAFFAQALACFVPRRDEQIMGQELLATVVSLCSFLPYLSGKVVRVWTDNAGGEGALRKGGAHSRDHHLMVHAVWLFVARHCVGLRIERVCSRESIADALSREEYGGMSSLGASWVAPILPLVFLQPKNWADIAL